MRKLGRFLFKHLVTLFWIHCSSKFQPIVDKENKLGTKIDWHDWEAVGADLRRQGAGENGASVKLAPDEEGKSSSSYINHGFSAYVSDKIAVDRSVPDIRHAL